MHRRRPKVDHLLRWPWPDWFTHHHQKNEKGGHDLKEKMAYITNLTSILTNSTYIERYEELSFEVYQLSCFDLTSKQLNRLAYIGRTSDNQRIKRIEQDWERVEEMKYSGKYLQWCAELDLACFNPCLITLRELAEVVWKWNKALDPRVLESPNSEIQTQISIEIY